MITILNDSAMCHCFPFLSPQQRKSLEEKLKNSVPFRERQGLRYRLLLVYLDLARSTALHSELHSDGFPKKTASVRESKFPFATLIPKALVNNSMQLLNKLPNVIFACYHLVA